MTTEPRIPADVPRDGLDALRAWAAGRLAPESVGALERRIGEDAAFAALARDVRAVYDATEVLVDEPAACPLAFSELGLEREPRLRRLARERWRAAGVMLLLLGGALLLLRELRGGGAREQVLSRIPLEAAAPEALAPLDLPDALADYVPVRDGAIQWVASLEEARSLALAADRPLFVFGMIETCPWCIEMQAVGLVDEEVLALADAFVPVRFDLLRLEPEEAQRYFDAGYPYLSVSRPDGEALHEFHGMQDGAGFRRHLREALAQVAGVAPPRSWSELHRLAERLQGAQAAEAAGDLAAACRGYGDVARRASGSTLGQAARRGERRVAEAARRALVEARELSREFPADGARRGVERLDRAVARFAGTPYASDLEAVRAELLRAGRFPPLASPDARAARADRP